MKVIETIYNASGNRRIHVYRRDDGTYGLEWEEYSNHPYEKCWIPCPGVGVSFCDTFETAFREARGRLGVLSMRADPGNAHIGET
jgi:hypothetical protein